MFGVAGDQPVEAVSAEESSSERAVHGHLQLCLGYVKHKEIFLKQDYNYKKVFLKHKEISNHVITRRA